MPATYMLQGGGASIETRNGQGAGNRVIEPAALPMNTLVFGGWANALSAQHSAQNVVLIKR